MSEDTRNVLEPDERFVQTLEQELRKGIRRRARLHPVARASTRVRGTGVSMLATASLMVLSLLVGATGTFAVVRQDPAPHRELSMQRATLRLERAQLRLEQHQVGLAEAVQLYEAGLAGETSAMRHRQLVSHAEAELRCRELDLKETQVTGRAPVDDLSAPPVDDDDFVVQRLETKYESVALERQQVQLALAQTEQLVAAGGVSNRELPVARAKLEEATQALHRLQQRIALRQSFIEGDIAAEAVELRGVRVDTEVELAVAEARRGAAQVDVQQLTALYEHGSVMRRELRHAQAALRDTESELALAEVQLTMIQQRLAALEQAE